MRNVLIVEDDPAFQSMLSSNLTEQGYEVSVSSDGKTGIEKAVLNHPDVILLDLKMPGMDGKEVCLCLKNNPRTSHIPIIILTGEQDICDEAEGLKIGAEDYLAKPFQLDVLRARLEKALERGARAKEVASNESFSPGDDKLQVGKVTLNLLSHSLSVDGSETALTPIEFKILTILMKNPGRIIPRKQLINDVWEPKNSPSNLDRVADTHMNNIRKKFGAYKDYLQTRYGTGYCLREPA